MHTQKKTVSSQGQAGRRLEDPGEPPSHGKTASSETKNDLDACVIRTHAANAIPFQCALIAGAPVNHSGKAPLERRVPCDALVVKSRI